MKSGVEKRCLEVLSKLITEPLRLSALLAKMDCPHLGLSTWCGTAWVSLPVAVGSLQSMQIWHCGTDPVDYAVPSPVCKQEKKTKDIMSQLNFTADMLEQLWGEERLLTLFSSRSLSLIATLFLILSYFSRWIWNICWHCSILGRVVESRGPKFNSSRSVRYASYSTLGIRHSTFLQYSNHVWKSHKMKEYNSRTTRSNLVINIMDHRPHVLNNNNNYYGERKERSKEN